jgi:serine/threonine-protein kinase
MPVVKNFAIGDIVAGKYRLLDVIGEGGMGVVYLAEHSLIEKRVALKVLRAEYSAKPDVVRRFQQEAISASRIKHPNVLDVFDFGQLEDGSFFLAMEYLQGRDLAAELSECTTVAPRRALRIALQMTRALAAAHARGVVHRDLKPENVFLHQTEEGDEIVKIVDFGIAQLKSKDDAAEGGPERRRRLTRTGMIFGTPEYMSPEQAAGRAVDLRSDVYAVGVMLYEMFSGAVPFTGATFMAVLSAHLTQPIPPMRHFCPELSISPELEAAVMHALEKDPDARYQSMRELATALQYTPEGRLANPVTEPLPVPEVSIASFRPARAVGPGTSPEFGKTPPLPFDLVSRGELSDPRNPRPIVPVDVGRLTQIQGTSDTAQVIDDSQEVTADSIAFRQNNKGLRPKLLLIVGVTLSVGVVGLYAFRQYKSRLEAAARMLVERPASTQLTDHGVNDVSAAPSSGGVVASSTNSVASSRNGAVANAESPPPVVLTVQTNLSGATVSKDGFQVCDLTPCTVEVARGTATELVATKGYARGTAKVLAQKDQTVTISLTFPKTGATKQTGQSGLCEVVVDGLKILRPCK